MLDSNLWIALIILLVTVSIGIGYVYFNREYKYEIYNIRFTSSVGRISAIWGSLIFGLGFVSGVGLVFSDNRLFFILLTLMALLGYVIGCAIGSTVATMGIPIWIRAIFGVSGLFGSIVFLRLFLQTENIELTTPNVLIPLVVSTIIAAIFILFSAKYRRLTLITLTISEIILVIYAVIKVS